MISIRPFSLGDLELGMRLKEAAGWNQTEADWRRAYELAPDGCFVGLCDGTPAATLATCRFGPVAWIAMVLTSPEFRGRGLATALMRHAIDELLSAGVTTIRLDATQFGRPVYEKLGFTVDYELRRWSGSPSLLQGPMVTDFGVIRPLDDDDWPRVVEVDRLASGCDRDRFLAALRDSAPKAYVADTPAGVAGVALLRPGISATQVGPVVAVDEECGRLLLSMAIQDCHGSPVFVDVAAANVAAEEVVRARCLDIQRAFWRMTLGPKAEDAPKQIFASSGPEKG
ncbi:MAG: GNAT family N-acetyltransferase [Pirellulales bacterium]